MSAGNLTDQDRPPINDGWADRPCPACGRLLRIGVVPMYGPNMSHTHRRP